MRTAAILLAGLATALAAMPANARTTLGADDSAAGAVSSGVLQCVPYARSVTGINIRGDAHTWWGQAAGRYARGDRPKVGAVMNLRPHGNSRLGHVAAVSRVIDSRTILIRHANWSSPGQIEDNVRAVDVSPDNDWSAVRVWYGPAGKLGSRHWPLYGFIYNEKPGSGKAGDGKVGRDGSGRDASQPGRARFASDPIGAIIAGIR